MGLTPAKIWVDDLRDPAAFGRPDHHWCKTITEAVRILSGWQVEEVSLDHDISHAILPGDPGENGNNIYQPVTCPEDYSAVAYFIAEMPAAYRPRLVEVHTSNETGSGRIHNILRGKVDNLVRRRL